MVSRGVTLPLEVFYTGSKRGWGLRCQSDIRKGAFICEYAGNVISDAVAVSICLVAYHNNAA